jgi:hypothetical protein
MGIQMGGLRHFLRLMFPAKATAVDVHWGRCSVYCIYLSIVIGDFEGIQTTTLQSQFKNGQEKASCPGPTRLNFRVTHARGAKGILIALPLFRECINVLQSCPKRCP